MNGFLKFTEAVGAPGVIEAVRKDALTDKAGEFTVDTCGTFDCGWETGVNRGDDNWVIVEEYKDKAAAVRGHKRWVTRLKADPDAELKDCRTALEWAFGKDD